MVAEDDAEPVVLAERKYAVVLSLSDCSRGTTPSERNRVFAHLDASWSTPGHGLGLNLVAVVAHAHGGTATLHDN